MNQSKRMMTIAAVALAMAATGCENPADGKAKAKVEEPAATTANTGAKPGKSAGDKAGADKKADAPKPEFTLDGGASKLEWTGSKVTGKHDGGFKAFSASANLKDGKIVGCSVNVEIETGSIFSDNEKLTGHLKSDEFFDVKKFPKATFASSEIKEGGEGDFTHTVVGNLTLHGETKKVTFPATITQEGDKVMVKSEFVINRKDFGMEYPGKPDDLIRDEVVIKLDLSLNKA